MVLVHCGMVQVVHSGAVKVVQNLCSLEPVPFHKQSMMPPVVSDYLVDDLNLFHCFRLQTDYFTERYGIIFQYNSVY